MPTQEPLDVKEWARRIRPDDFSFADLDAHLFADEPEILTALGRGPGSGGGWTPLGCVTALVGLVVYVAPLAGVTAFLTEGGGDISPGADGFSTETAMALATVCFWLAIPAPILTVIGWWRHGRRADGTSYALIAYPIICGLLALFIMQRRGEADGVPWESAVVPVWITIGVSVIVGVGMVVFARKGVIALPAELVKRRSPDEPAVARLLTQQNPRQIDRWKRRRREALDILDERGVITGGQWQRADLARLGELHHFDDQRTS